MNYYTDTYWETDNQSCRWEVLGPRDNRLPNERTIVLCRETLKLKHHHIGMVSNPTAEQLQLRGVGSCPSSGLQEVPQV